MERPFDLAVTVALLFISIGVVYLLFRNSGGGGGDNTPFVVPSSRWPGGGWQPGFVSTLVRNGGNGAASPNVSFN